MRTIYCGQVNASHVDQQVTLCGWVHRRRDLGGLIFIDMRDREGIVQVFFDPDRPEAYTLASELRNEFCIQITGLVRGRRACPQVRHGHQRQALRPVPVARAGPVPALGQQPGLRQQLLGDAGRVSAQALLPAAAAAGTAARPARPRRRGSQRALAAVCRLRLK